MYIIKIEKLLKSLKKNNKTYDQSFKLKENKADEQWWR